MKCIYCNYDNNENAKFCINCGKLISSAKDVETKEPNNNILNEVSGHPKMTSNKLVPAKCTNCGATLTLDPSKETAICPFCNSSFIVNTAIKNYNTLNINNNININDYRTDNEWTYRKTETEKKYDLLKQKEQNALKLKIVFPLIIIICIGLLILWLFSNLSYNDFLIIIAIVLILLGPVIISKAINNLKK